GSSYFRLPRQAIDAAVTGAPAGSAGQEKTQQGNTPEAAKRFHPQEIHVDLSLERYTPKGTLILRGAKIVTMHGDEILARGDILVRDNRIVSVGASGSFPVPAG